MQNILLDEGIRIFKKKMDLIRFFKKLYKKEENVEETTIITMSESCKNNVVELLKKQDNSNKNVAV